jgi:hypothetical protein
MRIEVRVEGVEAVTRALQTMPRELRRELRGVLRTSANQVRRGARARMPRFEGILRSRVDIKFARGGLSARVRARAPHAILVEGGRKPGKMASLRDGRLAAWAERRGIGREKAFVIARAIGAKGIKPRPFMQPAAEDARPGFIAAIRQVLQRVAARF